MAVRWNSHLYLSTPTISIQSTIINRFGNMSRLDIFAPSKVRYGTSHLDDAIIGTSREI